MSRGIFCSYREDTRIMIFERDLARHRKGQSTWFFFKRHTKQITENFMKKYAAAV